MTKCTKGRIRRTIKRKGPKDAADEEAWRIDTNKKDCRSRYPYESRIVGGKLMTPADVRTLHRFILDTAVIEVISELGFF